MRRPGLAWVVFGASFVAYAWMAAPGVEWMDSGELTAAAWSLGGAHPPGHPAHTLIGKLATFVPVGEIAFRVNVLSALAMAAAIAGVVALARALVNDSAIAAGAAAALAAASPLATTNATRAEVYAPAAALLVWAAVATVRYLRDRDARMAALAAAGCAGAAAVHPVIALSASLPMAIAVIVGSRGAGRGSLRALIPRAGVVAVVALATYVYLPVRAAAADPPLLMWGDPTSFDRFVDLVTAPAYQSNFELGGAASRFAGLWMLAGEGAGLGLLFAGLAGLGFAAVTRLRGAGVVLAAAACTLAGASLQSQFNPDMPGYALPALLLLAAGVAPLVAAIQRALPDPIGAHRAVPYVALAPIVGLALLGPIARADDGGARSSDDALRHWDATIGEVPPGPAVYFANADHALFPAQYERIVAGARPDVALANRELVRDIWFLRHIDRMLPALYVPFVDDLATDSPAERLAAGNLNIGGYVGGDEPAFGQLRATHAAPRGRGWRYALRPIDVDQREAIPPAPADYRGATGHRVAGYVAMSRAVWEAERGRLDRAARAAGLEDRFGDDGVRALAAPTKRPHLYGTLPAHTRVFLYADWQAATLGDDLAWRAGLGRAHPADSEAFERRLLAAWHALLEGEPGAGAAVAGFGHSAELATAKMLFDVRRLDEAQALLAAMIERDPRDVPAIVLLGSLRGNLQKFDEAEALFARAIEVDPSHADAHARLGLARAKQGNTDGARDAWQRALDLDPSRRDVAGWLRSLP
jgi:hypothetical protein